LARPPRQVQINPPAIELCEDAVVHLSAVRSAYAALPPNPKLDALSRVFAALGDPTRLRVVTALAATELCVCDIAAVAGTSDSSVSHHLRVLRDLGLVRSRKEGRLVYYALDDEHVHAIVREAVAHVEHQTEAYR
jgi:ArsR family transcriptional regulator